MRFFEKLVVAYFFGPPCIWHGQTINKWNIVSANRDNSVHDFAAESGQRWHEWLTDGQTATTYTWNARWPYLRLYSSGSNSTASIYSTNLPLHQYCSHICKTF